MVFQLSTQNYTKIWRVCQKGVQENKREATFTPSHDFSLVCMEILFLKLSANIFFLGPGLIAFPKNTLVIYGLNIFLSFGVSPFQRLIILEYETWDPFPQ
jgi:hypothetical protein